MKRTTLFVEEAQERDLDALAERERRSKADLVREAIGEYLVRKGRGRGLPGYVGSGRSGERNTAERHEEVVFTDLEPHGEEQP